MSNFQRYTGPDKRTYPSYDLTVVNGDVVDFGVFAVPADGRWTSSAGPATKGFDNVGVSAPSSNVVTPNPRIVPTTSGPPTVGTYSTGDVYVGQDGSGGTCTAGGSPGSWVSWSALGDGSSALPTQTGQGGKFLATDGTAASWLTSGMWASSFGVVADGRLVLDAVTNSTATVTSSTAAFVFADQGKVVNVSSAADQGAASSFSSTILTVNSSSSVTLAASVPFSLTGCNLVLGTDNATSLAAALTAAAGNTLHLQAGIVCSSAQHVVPGDTTVLGAGHDYGLVNSPPSKGTVLQYCGPSAGPFISLGSDGTGFASGSVQSNLMAVSVDGANLASAPVKIVNRRSRVAFCQIWRGRLYGLNVQGQNARVVECVIGQQNNGDSLYITASDVKVHFSEIRQGGGNQIKVSGNDVQILGCHIYGGATGSVSSSNPGSDVYVYDPASNVVLTGNLFDGTYGHHIQVVSSGGDISAVTVTGNLFFQVTGGAGFACVYLDAASGRQINGVSLTGNAAGGGSMTYLAQKSAATGTLANVSAAGNTGYGIQTGLFNFTPDGDFGNSISNQNKTTTWTSAVEPSLFIDTPADWGYKAWTVPVKEASAAAALTSGQLYAFRVKVPKTITVSNIDLWVNTAGSSLTAGQNLVGIYSSGGTRLAVSGDLSSAFGSVGQLTAPVGPVTVVGGPGVYVYVAVLSVGTTTPSLVRTVTPTTNFPNVNLGSAYLTGTAAGQTSLPTTLPALTNGTALVFAGLK